MTVRAIKGKGKVLHQIVMAAFLYDFYNHFYVFFAHNTEF